MDRGDYATAFERANELVAIDATWNEVKLFLDDVVARESSAPPIARSPAPPAATPPTTEARSPAALAPATRPPRLRTPLLVVLTLVAATLGGWAVTRALPPGAAGRSMVALGNSFVDAGRWVANEILPSPTPPPPKQDSAAEMPSLPTPSAEALPPSLPDNGASGNEISQKRKEAGLEERAASPPAADPTNGAAAGVAPRDAPLRGQTVPQAPERGTPPREPQGPPTREAASPGAPAPAAASSTVSPSPSTPPAPLVSPNTTAQIETPVVPKGTTGQQAAQNIAPPSPGLPPVVTPATEQPSPARPATTAGTETTAPPAATTAAPSPNAATTSDVQEQQEQEAARQSIAATLGVYAQGYSSRDVAMVKRVWPTVNEEALGNAFEQLSSQLVAFSGCNLEVRGLYASATCRGTARYVPSVGNREAVSVSRIWRFSLRKRLNTWIIDSVTSQ